MIAILLFLAVVLGLAVLPQMWVRKVIGAIPRSVPTFPAPAGEFARHLLDEMKLHTSRSRRPSSAITTIPRPRSSACCRRTFNGRSLAAVVIAAHEAGHAMQDATGYGPLQARTRLAKQAIRMEKVGAVVMLAAPDRHGAGARRRTC